MTDPADIASKRTPGPRTPEEMAAILRRLDEVTKAAAVEVAKAQTWGQVPAGTVESLLNTYDELLAVRDAAREMLTEWDTHGTEAAVWVLHQKVRHALAALDAVARAEEEKA